MFAAASLSDFQTWSIPNPRSRFSLFQHTAQDTCMHCGSALSVPLLPLPHLLPLLHFFSNATASYPLRQHSFPHAPPSTSPGSHSKSAATHAPSSGAHTENRTRTPDSSASSSPLPACTPPNSNKNYPCLPHTHESSPAASVPASPNSFECCNSNRTHDRAYKSPRCGRSSPSSYPIAVSDTHRLQSDHKPRPKFQSAPQNGYGSP